MLGTMPVISSKIDELLTRTQREIDAGLLPSCQIALAHDGELVAFEAFGDATVDTSYCLYSATKAFVAGVMWQLIGEGAVDVSAKAADLVPEFGTNGKDVITVEQVMLHTSGFPHAPLPHPVWSTRDGRLERFGQWRLNWDPGTRYEYHPTSAHWVLAEIIDRVTGGDYRDEVDRRIVQPLGLRFRLGVPVDEQAGIAELQLVGQPATPDELEATFGVREVPVNEVTDDALVSFNDPDVRAVGIPGGGGFGRAADLALYYQALLHNTSSLWDPAVLADATGNVRNSLPDPFGTPANRSLGLILAGDDGRSGLRGFGRTVSAGAFGHNGAGGQLAWADPATGLSLGYVTNGLDRHIIREGRRGVAIGSMAGVCA
jgi:CubicO group peptidase (beta-lactamase class C family)